MLHMQTARIRLKTENDISGRWRFGPVSKRIVMKQCDIINGSAKHFLSRKQWSPEGDMML